MQYGSGVDSVSNRNEYQQYLPGGVGWQVRRANNLSTFKCPLSRNSGSLNLLEPQGLVQAWHGIAGFTDNSQTPMNLHCCENLILVVNTYELLRTAWANHTEVRDLTCNCLWSAQKDMQTITQTFIINRLTTEAEYSLGARDTKSLGIDTSSLFSFLVLIDKRTKMYQSQNLSC